MIEVWMAKKAFYWVSSGCNLTVPLSVPIFHSFRFQQEFMRFREIVTHTFKEPEFKSLGQSLQNFIKTLGPIEVLHLEKGQKLV